MFLTRIGFGSKCVVTGDVSQIDLPQGHAPAAWSKRRAVLRARRRASRFTRFTAADVVRHPLVARIVEAYDRAPRVGERRVMQPTLQPVAAVRRRRAPRAAAAPPRRALAARRARGAGADHGAHRRRRRRPCAEPRLPRQGLCDQRADLRLRARAGGRRRPRAVRAGRRAPRRASRARTCEAHYAHLLVHGALHAQGHDHQQRREAERMENKERTLLRALGFEDPYAG